MSREKSPLTQDMIFTLGNILSALTSTNITEDIIRTVCRKAGIAAVGQGDLSAHLKEFRKTVPEPKDKLSLLAEIIPPGLLLALLLVAQEFVDAQVTQVYQTDVQANRYFQSKLAALENDRVEALTAANTKDAECKNLAMELGSAQKIVADLTERNMALEKETSVLLGRLQERDAADEKKNIAKVGGLRTRVIKAQAVSKKRPQKNAGKSTVNGPTAKVPSSPSYLQPGGSGDTKTVSVAVSEL